MSPPVRFVGDELDLYAEYHFELVKKTVREDTLPSRRAALRRVQKLAAR